MHQVCLDNVKNSIGVITALNPYLGYEVCTRLAKEALQNDCSVYDLVLQQGLLSKAQLEEVMAPENMVG